MSLINRKWNPVAADEWRKEDIITIIISPLAYICITIGIGLSLLLLPLGFICLIIGIILTFVMHWIIDPKLRVISTEYEHHQQEYLQELEKNIRWEEMNG